MKKLLAAATTAVLAVGLVAAGVAIPAVATNAPNSNSTVTGSASCQADGTYTVTWTYTSKAADGIEAETKVIKYEPSGATLGGNGVLKGGQLFLSVWSDHQVNVPGAPVKTGSWTQTFTQSNIPGSAKKAEVMVQTDWKNGPNSEDPVGTVTLKGDCTPPDTMDHKIDICHAPKGNEDKWVSQSVDFDSIVKGDGHDSHQRDIIPPFDYVKNGVNGSYPGKNWNADGRAIYNNDCALPPPPPPCIANSAVSYTYSPATNSGVITVAAVPGSSGVLCQPLYVTATSWKYTSNGVWPQVRDVVQKLPKITTPGTYPYAAAVSCGQGDIYASRTSQPEPTENLYGPNNPFAETFLHGMGFTGPNPTWVQQTAGCNQVTPVTPVATVITACGVYGSISAVDTDKIDYTIVGNGTTGVNYVTAVAKSPYVLKPGVVASWQFNLGQYTDCVTPEARISTDVCYPSDGESYKNPTFTFDNSASTVALVFTVEGTGISETVAAGATKTVAGPPVTTTGQTFTVKVYNGSALVKTITLEVPAFTGCLEVTPAVPTVTDQTCVAGNLVDGGINAVIDDSRYTYTVTDAQGTETVLTKSFTAFLPGTYTVSVTASTGYVLDSAATWPKTLTISAPVNCAEVSVLPVIQSEITCPTDGSYTIPAITGVVWKVDGTVVQPGTYPVTRADTANGPYLVTVTASPASANYELIGQKVFDLTFTAPEGCDLQVNALASAQACVSPESNETASGFVTVSTLDNVTWTITKQGTDTVTAITALKTDLEPGTYEVTATPDAGYTVNQKTFIVTVQEAGPCIEIPVVVFAPATDITCEVDGSYTLPETENVIWMVNGVDTTPGTKYVSAATTVQVTARLTDPAVYKWAGGVAPMTEFIFTAPEGCGVVATAVADPQVCTSIENEDTFVDGGITVTLNDKVTYKYRVSGSNSEFTPITATRTAVAPGTYQVIAETDPTKHYTFIGDSEWTLTVDPGNCDLPTDAVFPAKATASNQTCDAEGTTSGTIKVVFPADEPGAVIYKIGNRTLTSETTKVAPGTYTVTATTADPKNAIDGKDTFVLTVGAADSAVCGDLTTLALTGAPIAAGGMLAGGLLFIGGVFLYMRRRQAAQ